jgi:hypothetical protein
MRSALVVLAATGALALAPAAQAADFPEQTLAKDKRAPLSAKVKQRFTTLTKVTVRAHGPSHRLVRVVASGPRLTYLAVCDLTTSTCVNAARARRAWVARLPAQDPDGPYAIGVVGRGPRGYVTGHFASDPPPAIPPIVNIG